jgi:hypothetical protein
MNRDGHREARSDGRPPTHLPYRGPDGATNAEALARLSLAVGGLPERGMLYRLTVGQSPDARAVLVAEFLGFIQDRLTADAARGEIALVFASGDTPASPDGEGSTENRLVLWPLDIAELAPIPPSDPDVSRASTARNGALKPGRSAGSVGGSK